MSLSASAPAPSGFAAAVAPASPVTSAVNWIAVQLDAEQGRWFLWIPVFFGAGIAIYFASPVEPRIVLAAGLFLIALAARVLARAHLPLFLTASVALCMASGLLAAKMRTWAMDAPVLERRGAYKIEGFVESFDRQSARKARAVIRIGRLTFDGREVTPHPFRARISVRGQDPLYPGASVTFKALLQPPPEPVMPGGYDFARTSYYQGIGASGFSLTKPEIVDGAALPMDMRLRSRLAKLRAVIGERITSALPGQTGAVAAALTVGQEAGLSEEALADLRGSGLAHIISISGLHMSLVAGTVFWFLRWTLAMVPPIALTIPVRAVAGGVSLVAVTLYLALSGASIAAVRSYLMIAVVFGAILLNRPALSLRNVALSAMLILAVLPDSLIDISFQMSFAATAALIAGYERFGRHLHFDARSLRERLLWQPVYFLFAVLITTATAGLAVEPFSAYYFHTITSYGALGNLLGGPPVDFIAMPAMMVALLAMPFGLEAWPLQVMGFGIDLMMRVAKAVASLPGAVVNVPAFPFAALFLMIAGGLWLTIWRRRWRMAGIALIGVGLALTSIRYRPDVFVDRDAKTVAVRMTGGLLQAPKSRNVPYSLAQWLKSDGDNRDAKEAISGKGFQCDASSCIAQTGGMILSFAKKPDALAEDCRRSAVLISALDVQQPCPSPRIVLDRGALWERGACTMYHEAAGMRIVCASDERGARPWSKPRHRRVAVAAGESEGGKSEQGETPDFGKDAGTAEWGGQIP